MMDLQVLQESPQAHRARQGGRSRGELRPDNWDRILHPCICQLSYSQGSSHKLPNLSVFRICDTTPTWARWGPQRVRVPDLKPIKFRLNEPHVTCLAYIKDWP